MYDEGGEANYRTDKKTRTGEKQVATLQGNLGGASSNLSKP